MNHVVIDIETLGTEKDAVVTEAAFVAQEANILEFHQTFLPIVPQVQDRRAVDPETVQWAKDQGVLDRYKTFVDVDHMQDFLTRLSLSNNSRTGFYCRQKPFDFLIMEHYFESMAHFTELFFKIPFYRQFCIANMRGEVLPKTSRKIVDADRDIVFELQLGAQKFTREISGAGDATIANETYIVNVGDRELTCELEYDLSENTLEFYVPKEALPIGGFEPRFHTALADAIMEWVALRYCKDVQAWLTGGTGE